MARSLMLFLQVLASDTPPHHQTTNRVTFGYIEKQIQMVKRLMEKAPSTGRSFQETLTGLQAQPLGDGLPSSVEILHGRSLVTRKANQVDVVAVCQSLIALQAQYAKNYDKAR